VEQLKSKQSTLAKLKSQLLLLMQLQLVLRLHILQVVNKKFLAFASEAKER